MENRNPNQSTNDNMPEDTDEPASFVEKWLSERRENDELESQMLDLVDEHRDGSELEETALLNALIEHADTQAPENDGTAR